MTVKTFFSILFAIAVAMPAFAQTVPADGNAPAVRPMTTRTNRIIKAPRGPVTAAAVEAATNAQPAAAPASAPVVSPSAQPSAPSPAVAPTADAPVLNAAPPQPLSPAAKEEIFPPGTLQFVAAPVEKVLDLYSTFSGRTILRDPALGELKGSVVLTQQTPLTRSEVIMVLEATLAMNKISVVKIGDKFLKVVPLASASGAAGAPDTRSSSELNPLGSFVTHIAQLKYARPSEMTAYLTPFGTAGMPAPVAIDSTGILILRDNEENVKRMLEMIEKIDVSIPAEIVSEVIPIKFAKAEEIAAALGSISGGGSSSTFGTRSSSSGGSTGSPLNRSGFGNTRTGTTTPGQPVAGAPSSGATFSSRIEQIVNRAATGSSSGDIQLIGPNKIIADVRANSLLVFASREDLKTITNIISKLDVVLQQVLIETIIMDVSLDTSWNLGLSAAQTEKNLGGNNSGLGGFNNGQPFYNFAAAATNIFPGNFVDTLPGGFNYFGRLGTDFQVALNAAASDGRATIIQKPRILTSHAKEGKIFLGESRAIVSGTYYNGGFGGGPSSQYQQQEAGISLIVTPYVNNDGLVVMEITQEISDFKGTTEITGVGLVPNIIRRNLSGEVAVNNGETVILGGIILDRKEDSRSGVPLLKDIPLLGALFSNKREQKGRSELVVLMRPTVLDTPTHVAKQTKVELDKMPGIRGAQQESDKAQSKAMKAQERKSGKRVFKDVTEPAPSVFDQPAIIP